MKIKISFVALLSILILGFIKPLVVFSQSANLVLAPNTGSFNKDSMFEVEVKISLPEAVTAAKIYLNFDNSKLTGESIDVSSSAFTTTWPEAIFDNSSGLVKLQAGQSTPGISGEVNLARLRFLAAGVGEVNLTLGSSSLLLTPDDRNLLTSFGTLATFTMSAPSSAGTTTTGGGDGGGGGGGASSGGGTSGGGSTAASGACTKRGDVDCNGSVDIIDLSKLLANWRKNFAPADFDKNSIVDIVDLSITLSNWKK